MDYEKAAKIIELAFLNTDGHLAGDMTYSSKDMVDALKLAVSTLRQQNMDAENAVCHDAFDVYGMEKNCGFLMEECGELLSAVNKLRRGRVRKDAVFEELADVQLVITAFAQKFGYQRFLEHKTVKLLKLEKTIAEIKAKESPCKNCRSYAAGGCDGCTK